MTKQEVREILASGGLSLLVTPKRQNGWQRHDDPRSLRKHGGDAIAPPKQHDKPAQPTRTG